EHEDAIGPRRGRVLRRHTLVQPTPRRGRRATSHGGLERHPRTRQMAVSEQTSATETPDVSAVGARLRELTGEGYLVRSLRPASTGYANTTWLVDAEPRSLAIKIQTSPAYVFERDPAFEPKVLAALAATTVPVPPLVAVDGERSLFGSPWFAMVLVEGIG